MIEAYPLSWPTGWPRTEKPQRSRFGGYYDKPSVAKATRKLQEEMRMLGGTDLIISTNLILRQDGLPRSSQKTPEDRGAAVYFKWHNEPMVIACDSYNQIGCNLWAMAKTIEAMRGIDRWGCSELLNRAFTGFKALPSGGTSGRSWWEVLEIYSDASEEEIKSAYRQKLKETHPDLGGDPAIFQEVETAYKQALWQ